MTAELPPPDKAPVLADRERYVLEMRFGLLDGRARTLAQVGASLGVTKMRIKQIEWGALVKLRRLGRDAGMREVGAKPEAMDAAVDVGWATLEACLWGPHEV